MALLTTYFDPRSPLSPKSPFFALQIVVFCSKHTIPIIIDVHIVLKYFYTTWVRGVAYQKQLSGPKLMVVSARGACKKLGPPHLFMQPLKLTTSNFVYELGLGSSLAKKNFYHQNWQGSGLGEHSKNLGPLIYYCNHWSLQLQIWYTTWAWGVACRETTFMTKIGGGPG